MLHIGLSTETWLCVFTGGWRRDETSERESTNQLCVCLQSAGSCCQSSCQFHRRDHPCRRESECKRAVVCEGSSAHCPDDDRRFFKADGTVCRGGSLVCANGSCLLSICSVHSLIPCQLKEATAAGHLCLVACQQNDGSCVPYHQMKNGSTPLYIPCEMIQQMRRGRGEMVVVDGSLCNGNRGFCDQHHQCLPLLLDESSNLVGVGLSSVLLTNYSLLFQQYWWTFLVFLLAQILLIPIVLLYFHSRCVPSDNPFLQ